MRTVFDQHRFRIGLLAAFLGATLIAPIVNATDATIVSQRERQFWPRKLVLQRGSVVRIKNDDKVTHHIFVKSSKMEFDSGEQPMGKTVELSFDKQGKFTVRCAIHPIMRLDVTVQ